jgi:hypothetical protein
MNTSNRRWRTRLTSAPVALSATLLVGVLTTTSVIAQTAPTATTRVAAAPNTPSDTPLTNAQLREEIVALRKEIVQLQQTQKHASAETASSTGAMTMAGKGMKKCKDGMNMGMQVDGKTGCMGMPDSDAAKGAADKPMPMKGMGMMEKEGSMATHAPTPAAPKDPPDSPPEH